MADQYMDEESGGLPTDETVIKETRPTTKGVSLEAKQSAEIRAKLMEMIQAREAEKTGFKALMEHLAISGGPGSFQSRQDKYNANQQAREQDIYNKRMGVAQLDTEQARLAQARAQAQQQLQQFKGMLGGPQGNATGVPPGAAEAYNALSPQEQQSFLALHNINPQAAISKLISRQAPLKPTDLERNVNLLTGLSQEQKQNILLSNLAPNVGEMVTVPDPDNPGYSKQVTKLAAQRLALEQGQPPRPGPLSAAAPPAAELLSVASPDIEGGGGPLSQKNVPPTDPEELYRYNQAKLDAANAQKGVLPFQDDTVVAEAPSAAAAPVVKAAPPVVAKPPAAAEPAVVPGKNTYPKNDPRWATKQAELEKQASDVAENIRKEKEIARQKEEDIRRSGETEALKLEVKKADEEQTALSARVSETAASKPYAQRIAENVDKIPPKLLGMLNQGTIKSAILDFVDQGVSAGTIGTVNLPGLKSAILKLDPLVIKDQRTDLSNPTLEAYQTIINDAARLSLSFARAVNKGMGSMSNYERQIVKDAVGTDPFRVGARGLKLMAKAVECEAANAADQQALWNAMQAKGKSWKEYKSSPQLANMLKNQEKRTAAAMGVKQ